MKPGKIIGLAIAAITFAMIGIYVSIPVMLLMVAFVCGAPLFTIMLGGAALGALSLSSANRPFDAEFDGMVEHIVHVGLGDQVQVMSTIPLFIYAGYLLAEAGTADRLVRFANAMLGWIPGGLAIVTIGTCALFTVFTGASGVTIIALGGVLMPALVKVGYPERFSVGLIAGTGSVGLLFPPALPLFIYGTVYGLTRLEPEIWDTRRFLFAGIVPGLVLVGMLSAVAVSVAIYKKLPRQRFDIKELFVSFFLALPELFVPFGVILGLASGIGLSEVAALTVLYTVILEVGLSRLSADKKKGSIFAVAMFAIGAVLYFAMGSKVGGLLMALGVISLLMANVPWGKPLAPKVLWTTTREAMAMVGAIFIIIFASTALTNFMVTADVPKKLVQWTLDHVESKFVFLLAINLMLLVVGTVMDIFSAIVVVLPLIGPIAKAYGIDPYHLGVIFLLNLEVGYLHPPVGLNLFITSVKFRRPITEVMWATVPFLITMIVALLVITYVPALTVVPEAERVEPIKNLAVLIHNAAEEGRSVKDVTIVDAAGTALKNQKGQQIDKKLSECAAITNEVQRDVCQQLFFDVSNCRAGLAFTNCKEAAAKSWTELLVNAQTGSMQTFFEASGANFAAVKERLSRTGSQPPAATVEGCANIANEDLKNACTTYFDDGAKCEAFADPVKCSNKAIAAWAVKELNGDVQDQSKAIIVLDELPLVRPSGDAVKDKTGTQIVKKRAECDTLQGSYQETCRELFITASTCKINPPDDGNVDGCIKDKVGEWVDANMPEEEATE